MSLPSTSAIPGAVTNLLAIATAALPANTTVYFGAERAWNASLVFQISEITGDQQPAEMGTQYRREEKFDLICSLISCLGSAAVDDFSPALSTLMTNFRLFSMAVANNPRLTDSNGNDAVRFAQVGNFHIHPETDANGQSAVYLDFAVRCEQRVTSLT